MPAPKKARRTPAPLLPHSRLLELTAIGVTAVALFAFLYAFSLDRPFHTDTTAYFKSLRDLRDGALTCGYANRCMVSYFLIPFAPFGDGAVKLGFVTAAVAFFVFAYLLFARLFSKPSAYVASLCILLAPAGLITVTHLKEDFVGLMFLAIALYLGVRPRRAAWRLLGPAVFALSLLSKESFLLFAPFYFLVYAQHLLGGAGPEAAGEASALRDPKRWFLLAGGVAITVAVTLAIQHDYLAGLASLTRAPHRARFMGPFSSLLPTGFELYERGLGNGVFFWGQLLGLAVVVLDRGRARRIQFAIFALCALLVAFFSMNTTVMTYRNFASVAFLTMPLAAFGLELLGARLAGVRAARIAVCALGAPFLVGLAARSYATVALHAAANPEEQFFAGLRSELAPDAVLLTMDYAGLAAHYLGVATKQHAPDAREEQAQAFAAEIERDAGRTYYLLPDALAYDARHTIANAIERSFTFERVYEGWFEDYHSMDFGYEPEELRALRAGQNGCDVDYRLDGSTEIGGVRLDVYRYEARCQGQVKSAHYPAFKGRVLPRWQRAAVYKLVRR